MRGSAWQGFSLRGAATQVHDLDVLVHAAPLSIIERDSSVRTLQIRHSGTRLCATRPSSPCCFLVGTQRGRPWVISRHPKWWSSSDRYIVGQADAKGQWLWPFVSELTVARFGWLSSHSEPVACMYLHTYQH